MVKNVIIKMILNLTPNKIKKLFVSSIEKKYLPKVKFEEISFAQEGEDRILNRYFEGKLTGFFVDVGAHHPKRFSNTCLFYDKGWKGINIDPILNMKDLFEKERPRDINLQIGIGEKEIELNYFSFNEPALNTFSKELAEEYVQNEKYFIVEQNKIKITTLESVLDQYLPKNTIIDFLSIDAEGFDFEVLKSNNFKKYRPKLILVEILNSKSIEEAMLSDIYIFLKQQKYDLYAKTINTCFFINN